MLRFTDPLGFEQITSLAAAAALTVPAGAVSALIQPDTQAVTWRDDGTAPTAAIGIVIAAGETFEYAGDLSAIRFIEIVAGANLNVSYYA
jgi:hypothetical protein